MHVFIFKVSVINKYEMLKLNLLVINMTFHFKDNLTYASTMAIILTIFKERSSFFHSAAKSSFKPMKENIEIFVLLERQEFN